jgi:uncharacterized protein YciI
MRRQRVIVRYGAGPAWGEGPPEDQADWDAHADFVDDLVARGTFVMGGPFQDNRGAIVLLEGVDAEEARRILGADPFVRNGVFVFEDVREWTVYVDELTPREG